MDVLARRRAIRDWLDSRPQAADAHPSRDAVELRAFELGDLDLVDYRRRRLPHWELEHSTYFVTFTVQRARGRPFAIARTIPPAASRGPAVPVAARLVEEAVFFGFGTRYDIDAYVVMPDHVHLLFTPYPRWTLSKILHGLKSFSALEVNRALSRSGPLWQDESFDHMIRGEADWIDKREYVHENPVTAGLTATAREYALSSAVTLDPPGRREALRHMLRT